MKPLTKSRFERVRAMKQRGVVLFFTLIALLAMSLAAVALIRSVDTSTLIAGNLAFKQAATSSGDAGIDAAMSWLTATQAANNANSIYTNLPAIHPFNVTDLTARPGYHSNVDPALNLTADATWSGTNSVLVGTDGGGNTIRYIIQRVCRNANQPITTADCLFSEAQMDNNGQAILLPQEVCQGAGCPSAEQSPQIRITARTTGPKNTVSYVQTFVY